MTVLVAILTVVLVLLGVLVAGLLRSYAQILRALHGLGVSLDPDADHNAAAPSDQGHRRVPVEAVDARLGRAADLTGVTPLLEPVAASVNGSERLTLLAFLSSGCLTCREFWNDFREPDLAVPGDARLVIVTRGPDAESPSAIQQATRSDSITVMSSQAWADYDVPGSPYFVLVDGSGPAVVGAGTGTNWAQVSRMLMTALSDAGIATGHHRHDRIVAAGDNRDRIEADLRAAGIGPNHPSLYPSGSPGSPGNQEAGGPTS